MTTLSDPTFRTYLPKQAASYAASRLSYPLALYEHVLTHHARTGGSFGTLLDVGCGPGNATRDMARTFDQAIGVDPGVEMINEARRLGGHTKTGEDVHFEVCSAEQCATAPGVQEGSVDLLIAAMSAHWFDMSQFWAQAAKAVKPGGTVALWTIASNYARAYSRPPFPLVSEYLQDPDTPNAKEITRLLLYFERETLAPFETPGNRLSRDMYDNLPLPWTIVPRVSSFPESDFRKDEWDRDGILTERDFFGGEPRDENLERLEQGLGTSSMVTRWRAAHPELAGTQQDCVSELIEELRSLLNGKGLKSCGSTAILFFKRA